MLFRSFPDVHAKLERYCQWIFLMDPITPGPNNPLALSNHNVVVTNETLHKKTIYFQLLLAT